MTYCRTKEAIQWLEDGDIIQHVEDEMYLKKENGVIFVSNDNHHWQEFKFPMEAFPPFVEWRSTTNLHYLNDLPKRNDLWYLDFDDKVLPYEDSGVDKNKKRWFVGGVL